MKKKILGIMVSLLAVVMLVTPVLAVSPKKIPVTIFRNVATFSMIPGTKTETGNALHVRGTLTSFGQFDITGEGIPDLLGYSSGIGKCDISLQNGKGRAFYEIVLTFSDGTFVGYQQAHGTFIIMTSPPAPPSWAGYPMMVEGTAHSVFQGTDAYKGWTLTFTITNGEMIKAEMLIP